MSEKHQTKIQDYVLCTKLSEKCDEVWNFFAKNKKTPRSSKKPNDPYEKGVVATKKNINE